MMKTIRFELEDELVKEIDKWVEKGIYQSREEFILKTLKKYIDKSNKKK